MDDAGERLATVGGTGAGAALLRCLGRGLLHAAPRLMAALGIAGTVAMFLVGGGILSHSLPFMPHATGLLALLLDAAVGIAAGALVLGVVLAMLRLKSG